MAMSSPRVADDKSEPRCVVVMFAVDAGADRRISLAAQSLAQSGMDVRLISARSPAGQPDDIPPASRSRQTSLRLDAYRYLRDRAKIPSSVMRGLYWRIDRRPERVFLASFRQAIAETPAAVYVANDLPMLPVALAAAERHGGRVLFDSHELYPEQEFSAFESRMWREVEDRYIERADAVVTVNESIAAELFDRHAIERPRVVENCDAWRVAAEAGTRRPLRQALGVADDAPLLLYQGGLSPGRNLETLVRAIPLLRNRAATLAILGDGPVRAGLERIAAGAGVSGRVRLHPAVPQDALPAMTASADVGVIPYQANCLNTFYCTPNKLYEYIMARLPIVATDLPELRRVVAGHEIGAVGDTQTPEQFAALIDRVLATSPQERQARRASLERAAELFCWENEGRKYVEVVDGLIRSSIADGRQGSRQRIEPAGQSAVH